MKLINQFYSVLCLTFSYLFSLLLEIYFPYYPTWSMLHQDFEHQNHLSNNLSIHFLYIDTIEVLF